jgi:hypothetical protein
MEKNNFCRPHNYYLKESNYVSKIKAEKENLWQKETQNKWN